MWELSVPFEWRTLLYCERHTMPCLTKFLRLHLGWYSYVPRTAPRFPIVICIVFAVTLFIWPETLFTGQPKMIGPPGKMPTATTIIPIYDSPGQWLMRSIIYQTIATAELLMMNGTLHPVLSANIAVYMVMMKAMTLGGIKSSYAWATL